MDINDMRIAVTLISMVLFIALVVHAWSRRRQAEYEAAAMLPFVEDGPVVETEVAGDKP